jgi:hypothetical protein
MPERNEGKREGEISRKKEIGNENERQQNNK